MLRNGGWLAIVALLGWAAWVDAAAVEAPTFRAGAAVVDVTPPRFPVRVNAMFTERSASKAVDPLYARSVAFDDGKTRLVFCIVDTCMMPRDLIDRAKQQAARATGVPVECMMVSATHTHSGVSAMGCLGSREDPDYVAFLPGKIAESIEQAVRNLQPAEVGWTSVDVWTHTHNRRWIRRADQMLNDPFGEKTVRANMHPGYQSAAVIGPSGPVDPQLSLLCARTPGGKPIALLANYSQHYFGSPLLSADYYGAFARHVATMLGEKSGEGPFVACMSQGTSGDLMWMDYGSKQKAITMDAYARGLADHAKDAYGRISWKSHVALGAAQKSLDLSYRVPNEKRLDWATRRANALAGKLPAAQPDIYALEATYLHQKQKTTLLLQAFRIGDLTVAGLPNEVYAITGLKLKAMMPLAAHFNIELANGAEGYIPPPEQHVLGGYTTWPARTAGLEVQAEPKIVATLLEAMADVAGKPCRALTDDHGPYARHVIDAKPMAYWRLNDIAGDTAKNAIAGGTAAKVSPGFGWYLPGVGTGTGTGAGEALTPSSFSGAGQFNRAIHLAGGELTADLPVSGDRYSMTAWVWLGEASGASERDGIIVTAAAGESLWAHQSKDHKVGFTLGNAATAKQWPADQWHLVVLTRQGNQLAVFVDGSREPVLNAEIAAASKATTWRFGTELQGKLDEIAVFDRVLTAGEVEALWKAGSP